MSLLYVLIGAVVVIVIWAIASSLSAEKKVKESTYEAPQAPMLDYEPDFDQPKAKRWEDGATATVSKDFGRGGAPTGISRDAGGLATAPKGEVDEDFERLKKARAFEPRSLPRDEMTNEEVSENA